MHTDCECCRTNSETLTRMESKIDRLDRHITGASEPGTGLIVRVDRIEQRNKLTAWLAGTALGAALSAIAAWIAK